MTLIIDGYDRQNNYFGATVPTESQNLIAVSISEAKRMCGCVENIRTLTVADENGKNIMRVK